MRADHVVVEDGANLKDMGVNGVRVKLAIN